ncbi:MAG: hypothetical protein ACFCD0_07685 [Gemmataceae bacterium]
MSVLRKLEVDGYSVKLNLSHQILSLVMPETPHEQRSLLPTLPKHRFPSAATLLFKAKQFDDGLVAAIELAVQQGVGKFPSKARLLLSLAQKLASAPTDTQINALAILAAACELGGIPVSELPVLPEAVSIVSHFRRDTNQSKPISFYTWNEQLKTLFQQDRLLQQPVEPEIAKVFKEGLEHLSEGIETYKTLLNLTNKFTNPPHRPCILDELRVARIGRVVPEIHFPRFLPPARSHEVDLIEKLYGDTPIPDGFELLTEFVNRVQNGRLSLTPNHQSGWYDYQVWSQEPLLVPNQMPEIAWLSLNSHYRHYLVDVFRAAFALTRETHAKAGGRGLGGGGGRARLQVIRISPDLRVEPTVSLYQRKVISYRFVRSVLEHFFGATALKQIHRLTPEGPVEPHLAAELTAIENLFAGAYLVSCEDIGMRPEANFVTNDAAVCREFRTWAKYSSEDRDLWRDGRMMVPVFYDELREKWKVWLFLGWDFRNLSVKYKQTPEVLDCRRVSKGMPDLREDVRLQFDMETHSLPLPVVAETYVTEIMDRDEFRRFCDAHQTRTRILAKLS